MNREIKFRVFNHGIKKTYPVYGLNQRQIQWANEDGSLGGSFSYGQKNKNMFTLLQFTGLLDKNGKEIYESDKIKRRVWLVEGQDYMDYICNIAWNGWCYGLFVGEKQLWALDPIIAKEIEIIGHIYEN